MSRELTLEAVRAVVKPGQAKNITTATISEINKLCEDPDYGPDFVDMYRDHLNIFKDGRANSHNHYMCCMKFFSLVEGGNNLTDAYIKTFPERYESRTAGKSWEDDQSRKDSMRHEASRFNRNRTLAEIRKAADVPIKLIYRHLLHEAILTQADLMNTAKSEMVRHLAAKDLADKLSPGEDMTLTVQVEDGARSAIEDLRMAANKLASSQREKVINGDAALKDIADAVIIEKEEQIDGS